MICTEAEAKTKWCPKALSGAEYDGRVVPVNRQSGGKPDPDCMCLGSACMLWGWWDDKSKPAERRRGTCGLIANGNVSVE